MVLGPWEVATKALVRSGLLLKFKLNLSIVWATCMRKANLFEEKESYTIFVHLAEKLYQDKGADPNR